MLTETSLGSKFFSKQYHITALFIRIKPPWNIETYDFKEINKKTIKQLNTKNYQNSITSFDCP